MVGVIVARLQPIHNGHIALITKAASECERVIVLVGSADKLNKRNPLPIDFRLKLAKSALVNLENVEVYPLDDLSDESHDDILWGFYLYSHIVSLIHDSNFTLYYSDGYEKVALWFPGFILRNNVSLSLLARNSCEDGISATKVREYLLNNDDENLKNVVPESVYAEKDAILRYMDLLRYYEDT